MAVDPKDKIVSSLRSLERSYNKPKIGGAAYDLVEKTEASTAQTYKEPNAVSGGVKNLAQSESDVISTLPESVPSNITGKVGLAKVDKSASTSLQKPIPDDSKEDLKSITGNDFASTKKQKKVAVTLSHPQALAKTFSSTTDESPTAIKSLVKSNVDTSFEYEGSLIDNIVGDVLGSAKGILGSITELQFGITDGNNGVNNKISFGFSSLLENVVELSFSPARNKLNATARIGNVIQTIDPIDSQNIIKVGVVGNDVTSAALILQKYSDKPQNELEDVISSIDNRVKTNAEPPAPVTLDIPVTRTDRFINTWREADTDPYDKNNFQTVADTNVLANEFSNLQREVTEVIISAYNGGYGNDQFVPIETWHETYVEASGTGYAPHLFIQQHGTLYRGRPLELDIPAAAEPSSHRNKSVLIHIAADESPGQWQMRKLEQVLKAIYRARPGIQVFGVGQISGGQDPYFQVPQYIKNTFGKSNVAGYNPANSDPLTREELAGFNRQGS